MEITSKMVGLTSGLIQIQGNCLSKKNHGRWKFEHKRICSSIKYKSVMLQCYWQSKINCGKNIETGIINNISLC